MNEDNLPEVAQDDNGAVSKAPVEGTPEPGETTADGTPAVPGTTDEPKPSVDDATVVVPAVLPPIEEPLPVDAVPPEAVQTDPLPTDSLEKDPLPTDPVPTDPVAGDPVAGDPELVDPVTGMIPLEDDLTIQTMGLPMAIPMVGAGIPRVVMANARNLDGAGTVRVFKSAADVVKGEKSPRLHSVALRRSAKAGGRSTAVATTQRDLLTAADPTQPCLFQWTRLNDSVLYGPRGSQRWDVITGFNGSTQALRAPRTVRTTAIQAASGSITQLTPEQIHTQGLGGSAFKANTAAAFTCAGYSGTFVVFNDNRPGYQANSDSLIFLADHQFSASAITLL